MSYIPTSVAWPAPDGDTAQVISPPETGPEGHLNWRWADAGVPLGGFVEFAIYSDARLSNEGSMGPYHVLNTVPTDDIEALPMSAVLRMAWHGSATAVKPSMTESDHHNFHGGDLEDEITALIALTLGIRAQSGGRVRDFRIGGDPLGVPVQYDHRRPLLPPARQRTIPSLAAGDLAALNDTLAIYPHVHPGKATEVVRAARAYQQGVWMSDADPEYAWLKFVSALEVAANCWWRGDHDPAAAMRKSKPELAELLDQHGGEALVQQVGSILKDQLRSTHRFKEFTERYAPPPPAERPLPVFQVDWNTLPRAMSLIYQYRSKSLHAGHPFPPPLLEAPRALVEGAPVEKPVGQATSYGSNVWLEDELPMLLHVFEYITRTSLLTWLHDGDEGPSA